MPEGFGHALMAYLYKSLSVFMTTVGDRLEAQELKPIRSEKKIVTHSWASATCSDLGKPGDTGRAQDPDAITTLEPESVSSDPCCKCCPGDSSIRSATCDGNMS